MILARDLGMAFGGVLGIFLLSRLGWWLLRKSQETFPKAVGIDAITYILSVFAAGHGMADGGPLQYAKACAIYLPGFLLVLAYDLFRVMRARRFEAELTACFPQEGLYHRPARVITTGERRTHLFAHRLGITLSALGAVLGLFFVGNLTVNYVTGFESRVAFYKRSMEENFRQSLIVKPGSKSDYGSQLYYLDRFSDDRAEHNRIVTQGRYAEIWEYLAGILLVFAASLAFYGIIRAVGWIVASLFV